MRLIDADKLRNIIYYGKCDAAYFDIATDREIVKLIDEQPTVNAMLLSDTVVDDLIVDFKGMKTGKVLMCGGECEKRIREDAIKEIAEWLEEGGLLTLWQGDYYESLSAEKVLEMYKEQK